MWNAFNSAQGSEDQFPRSPWQLSDEKLSRIPIMVLEKRSPTKQNNNMKPRNILQVSGTWIWISSKVVIFSWQRHSAVGQSGIQQVHLFLPFIRLS